MRPQLLLSHTSRFDASTFEEFRENLASEGERLLVEERDEDGPYAGIEWLIPTAVVFFIGKAYVDGFVKEIGKDHYALVKQALKTLYEKLVGPKAPALVIVGTAGKVRRDNPYSLVFSLLAEGGDGIRFKLLIRRAASEEEYAASVAAFCEFIDAFHGGRLSAIAVSELRAQRQVGGTILLAYHPEQGRVVPVDPLQGIVK